MMAGAAQWVLENKIFSAVVSCALLYILLRLLVGAVFYLFRRPSESPDTEANGSKANNAKANAKVNCNSISNSQYGTVMV